MNLIKYFLLQLRLGLGKLYTKLNQAELLDKNKIKRRNIF